MSLNAPCARCATMLDVPTLGPGALVRCGSCQEVNRLTPLPDGRLVLTLGPSESKAAPPPRATHSAAPIFSSAPPHQPAQPYPFGHAPAGNYVWGALNVLPLFFCFPIGLFSLVFGIASISSASRVHPAWMAGDAEGAHKHARSARNLGIFGLVLPAIAYAFMFLFFAPMVVRHF